MRELRAVAEEIAADPRYADEEPIGPDEAARDRFREFARRQLGDDAPEDSSIPGRIRAGAPPPRTASAPRAARLRVGRR